MRPFTLRPDDLAALVKHAKVENERIYEVRRG
jgi:hypothetical protein